MEENFNYRTLKVSLSDYVCTIVLNRPHKKNALSRELVNELTDCLLRGADNRQIRVFILEGAESTFCTGADLSGMAKPLPEGPDALPDHGGFVALNLAFTTVGKPVIAKIRKYALGGGLGLVCASHWVREQLNEKYDNTDICLFETTSLYGTTKGMSMYDGLKPFVRHAGDTVSDFPPPIHDHVFNLWDHWFKERNGGEYLVPMITPTANNPNSPTTSRKDRSQNKMKSVIRNSMKKYNLWELASKFKEAIERGKSLTERKRYYYSTYGYSNVADVILNGAKPQINKDNWDKHHLENIIAWWKKKAQKRWESLKAEGKLRTQLEIQGTGMDIDIIR